MDPVYSKDLGDFSFDDIKQIATEREIARRAGNFAEADRIRDFLSRGPGYKIRIRNEPDRALYYGSLPKVGRFLFEIR